MGLNKLFIFVFLAILIIPSVLAFTPPSNIDGRNYYTILNFTNISADEIYQDGSLVLNNESVLNVNSSVFWGIFDSISVWFKQVGTVLSMNTTELNTTIDARNVIFNESITTYIDSQDSMINTSSTDYADNLDTYQNTSLTSYTDGRDSLYNTSSTDYADNLDTSQNTSLTSYIDGRDTVINDSATEYADNKFIVAANESNLNVNSSTFWGILDDINIWFIKVGTSLGFNTSYFNMTYDKKYTATYNATYEGYRNNVSLNHSINTYEMWDTKWTDTYNATYEGYRNNVSINHSLNSYDMWNTRWTDTYNATYEGYRDNVSLNYSLNSYSMWDKRWTDTYNETYAVNESQAAYDMWDERWTTTYNESYDNKSEYAFGYNNFEGQGNITANWFFGKLNWSWIQNKFITSVGKYFWMDGTILKLNTSELNDTIDDRVAGGQNYTAGLGIKLILTNFSVEAGNGLEQEISGLKVSDAGIDNTQLRWKTGQNLTTSDAPTFDNVTISTEINPLTNLTFGKGLIISQGEYIKIGDHFIFENSTGALIII